MTIHLEHPLLGVSRNQPGQRAGKAPKLSPHATPIRSCSQWGLPCRCHCWKRGALLPHRFTRAGIYPAVCFLWHFPWGCPRRTLSGTVFPWSPDFPPLRPFGHSSSGHPANWRGRVRRLGFQGQQLQNGLKLNIAIAFWHTMFTRCNRGRYP